MVRQLTTSISDARYFVHPQVPNQRIFCISDPIHLFKRFRNKILNGTISLAPELDEEIPFPAFTINPNIYTCPLSGEFYESLLTIDAQSIMSISPLSIDCIRLTPRTKLSFPLAKLFHPRTILSLDALQDRLQNIHDLTGSYLAFSAKTVVVVSDQLEFG